MSASLVGSEMCIRDSHSQACASLPQVCEALRQARRPRWPTPPPPQGRWPVSYTHLTLPTICSV
eukprot:13980275-Alexandrium_andersonii.AAC.1